MEKLKITREYLGTTITAKNYREINPKDKPNRDLRNFHNKHLKAYLAGMDEFQHGWTRHEDGSKTPNIHPVEQKFTVTYLTDKQENGFFECSSQKALASYLKKLSKINLEIPK
jgi:hypothetical protein